MSLTLSTLDEDSKIQYTLNFVNKMKTKNPTPSEQFQNRIIDETREIRYP